MIYIGFKRPSASIPDGSRPAVSVIVPFRNEADVLPKTIPALVEALGEEDELILVDDHSEDDSRAIALKWASDQIKVMSSQGEGKKPALAEGISRAKHAIIVTSDADVFPQSDWLESMAGPFKNEDIHMVCGAVQIITDGSIRSKMEQVDVMSLVGSGHSFTNKGWAVMCNGANLSFRRSTFDEVGGYDTGGAYVTGDDVFLMHRIFQQYPKGVVTIDPALKGGVETPAQDSFKQLWSQRVRWASKTGGYQSLTAQWIARAVFGFAFAAPALLILGLRTPSYFDSAIGFLIGKMMMDVILLTVISKGYGKPLNPFALFITSLIQPFYTTALGFASQLTTFTWKGRQSSARLPKD